MSWTTSAPFNVKRASVLPPVSTTPITPPSVSSPGPSPKQQTLPRSLTLAQPNRVKPRAPIAPHKLAKVANALGVSTPSPASAPYPLSSPSTPNGASFGSSSSTPSRYLLHVIPPIHLLFAEQEDSNDPHAQAQFRRGTLVALHPTLAAQLGAIAREFSLPSIGGMILYLITADNEPGPRITDDAWRMLWYRALQVDKDGSSNGKTMAKFHSRSTTSAANSPYPSPSTTSDSPYERIGSPGSAHVPTSSAMSLDLPISINPGAALPILAKVEFDIDRKKAPWYELWRHRRRTTSHSLAISPHINGGLSSSSSGSGSTRVLQLPLRARSTSPSLANFKAKYAPTPDKVAPGSPEWSEDDRAKEDYLRLDDDDSGRSVHLGEFTEDPLEGVFPSDRTTWAQIRAGTDSRDESTLQSPTSPHTPDVLMGGRIGSTILSLEGTPDDEIDDEEEVVRLWKEKHKVTLDALSAPGSPAISASGGRSRSASKHIPPPLDLSTTSKSSIPHVEIAPPTATSINSDLPYLDPSAVQAGINGGQGGAHSGDGRPSNGNADIQIFVEGSSVSHDSHNTGNTIASRNSAASLVASEEARSQRLDELERRIENLSPRSQWDENALDSSEPRLVDSPEPASPPHGNIPKLAFGSEADENDADDEQAPKLNPSESETALSVPSSKASRRQVSIGSFHALPGGKDLAQALAAQSSPPLPPIPTDEEEARDVLTLAPIDLSTPMTPGFPLSPDPFNREPNSAKEVTSPTSPPPRVSSRFSADSVNSDEGASKTSRADRAGSIISVKGIRSLWRKSGNSKNPMPLMSPGINGQQMVPPTPPPFLDGPSAPPLPLSAGGYFSPISMQAPPLPKVPRTSTDTGTDASRSSSASTTKNGRASPTVHRRSDSGLDPFHFDQESRYPVHHKPSPSQAFTDQVPPPASPVVELATAASPPPPGASHKKGILKGWVSKGGPTKRISAELSSVNSLPASSVQTPNHPPSSFGSIGSGKKTRRPSLTNILTGGGGHSKQSSKASISSVGTGSKHNHPNNSLSGTSHASSHQGAPSLPSYPEPTPPSLAPSPQPPSSGRTSPSIGAGHKATGSSGSGLAPAPGELRKSTPPPPGAFAIAAAVAASRERRGTSYIGPPDNRI